MTTLAFDDIGGGTPLVLLHGIMSDRTVFADLIPEFADRRVINIDLRGYGRSATADRYLTQDFAKDVAWLLEALGTGPLDLLGWSMGGAVAQVLAAARPQAVRNLLLVSTTPCLVQRPDWEPAIPPAAAAELGELLAQDWGAGAAAFAGMVVNEPDQPEALALVGRLAAKADPEVNLACFGNLGAEDRRPYLPEISTPVHVICGSEDQITPPDASRYLAEVTKGSLTILDGAGHAPFLTARKEFVAAVRTAVG
ncbi:MAG: alpha/beta fold hydrolase [Sporichthyaceae bacterium]